MNCNQSSRYFPTALGVSHFAIFQTMPDCHCCHSTTPSTCSQSLDELDFERSIYNACVQGNLAKLLKSNQHLLNIKDKFGYTCLHYAALHNRLEICKYLVDIGVDLNQVTPSGATALYRACIKKHYRICEFLVLKGANVEIANIDGCSPITLSQSDVQLQQILALRDSL